MKSPVLCLLLVSLLNLASVAQAQFNSGSDGSDGVFNPGASTEIDLSLAGTGPGNGVYDPARWVIIFNYTTVDIPAGVTVTFKNHPSCAPVVWLATGDVTINGFVNLSGGSYNSASGTYARFAEPGPGGFHGGRQANSPWPGTAGFGPGGGPLPSGGGGHGTPGSGGGGTYGNLQILPLIGGSGGTGGTYAGGAGGGALLIASSGDIYLSGSITANGGAGQGGSQSGSGSGGAIRLLGNAITGTGSLRAQGQTAGFPSGDGRIRVEAYAINLADPGIPAWSFSFTPGSVFPSSSAPTLTATVVGPDSLPDPICGIVSPDIEVADSTAVLVQIEATNIPPGTTVDVHVLPDGEAEFIETGTLTGSVVVSTAAVPVTFPAGRSEVYLRANWMP